MLSIEKKESFFSVSSLSKLAVKIEQTGQYLTVNEIELNVKQARLSFNENWKKTNLNERRLIIINSLHYFLVGKEIVSLDEKKHSDDKFVASLIDQLESLLSSLKSQPLPDRVNFLASQISIFIGRPIRYSSLELVTFLHRAITLLRLAPIALETVTVENSSKCHRVIEKVPLGVVLLISAWNYPYLTVVGCLISSLLSGNAVILKHSIETAFVAEELVSSFESAGLPRGVFQVIRLKLVI